MNIKHAKQLNMCRFVIMLLCKARQSGAEKAIVKSCMLYLMVKYLDSLELQDVDISDEGTRVSIWTNAMVKKAISQDTGSDGRFGMAPLKSEFRNTDTESLEETEHGHSSHGGDDMDDETT